LIQSLARVPDSPERTALSYAIGIFWSFNPLLGLHTVGAIGTAFVFKLNKVAMLLGVWTNLPWFVVPYYAFATWFGMKLLGTEGITLPNVGFTELFQAEFWNWVASQWRLLIPAFVGSTIISIALSSIAYPFALIVVRRYRSIYEHEPLIDNVDKKDG
jgi:uncharacterized protein (DUF2062 family)